MPKISRGRYSRYQPIKQGPCHVKALRKWADFRNDPTGGFDEIGDYCGGLPDFPHRQNGAIPGRIVLRPLSCPPGRRSANRAVSAFRRPER
jgi:hypothetical protein